MLQPPEKFIGITGGSCSGKTTLEHNLAALFGDRIALFPFDDMFVGRSALTDKTITDWEDPNLYRWNDFVDHMRNLKEGRAVTIAAKSRESKAAGIDSRQIEPRPIVAVVGFLTLHHPDVRKLCTATIYLDIPEEEIIRRRIARANPDSPWDTAEYIHGMLIPGHRRIVVPQREFADHALDATVPPRQLAGEVAAIIQRS